MKKTAKKKPAKKTAKKATMNSPNRTQQHGARSRGQTFNYLPRDLTIIGDSEGRFAAWVKEHLGKHGPKVVNDSAHPLYDPRVLKVFEPEWREKLEALAADVREHGVDVPIATSLGETTKGQPQVLTVYGRRRILAAALAIIASGTTDEEEMIIVPALSKRGTMEELRKAMLAENDNRENNPPSVQAENVHRAVEVKKQPIQQIANRMGKPVIYLERLLKLRECEPAVIRAVDEGVISVGPAIDAIRQLPPKKQVEQAERMLAAPAKSGRGAAAQVRDENPDHAAPPSAPTGESPPAPAPTKLRPRKLLVEERDALIAKLADPKHDGARKANEIALAAIRWVLSEADERPSERKPGKPHAA